MFKFISCLDNWRLAPVGFCIVDGWIDHWCTDVSVVFRKLNRNAAAFLTYATTSSCTEVFKYYTTEAPEFYTTTYAAPGHYTDALKYYSAPSYYTTKATDYYMTMHAVPSDYTEAPNCYTEAPADYSTKTAEYYTEAGKSFSVRSTQPQLRRPIQVQQYA
ncbi:uncharacterized protein LOC124192527 [Daphnia pulex]|uniref:uncharacterized protein LOC124192527 n=1 Tax=Daphnia pulex TaxID=6669 RepID=UPI001EE12719|nr:uncharacterized protein LOC124192527 [Daphnia pulex]